MASVDFGGKRIDEDGHVLHVRVEVFDGALELGSVLAGAEATFGGDFVSFFRDDACFLRLDRLSESDELWGERHFEVKAWHKAGLFHVEGGLGFGCDVGLRADER